MAGPVDGGLDLDEFVRDRRDHRGGPRVLRALRRAAHSLTLTCSRASSTARSSIYWCAAAVTPGGRQATDGATARPDAMSSAAHQGDAPLTGATGYVGIEGHPRARVYIAYRCASGPQGRSRASTIATLMPVGSGVPLRLAGGLNQKPAPMGVVELTAPAYSAAGCRSVWVKSDPLKRSCSPVLFARA